MATTNIVKQSAAEVTLTGTELNSAVSGTLVVSSIAVNNLNGGGTSNMNGYGRGVYTLNLNATGNTISGAGAVWVWFLRSTDGGGTYEDSASQPNRPADLIFYPKPIATAQVLKVMAICPAGYYKLLILPTSLGSGGSAAQFGNSCTIKVLTETDGTV